MGTHPDELLQRGELPGAVEARLPGMRWLALLLGHPYTPLAVYLVALCAAEVLTVAIEPRVGLWTNSALLIALIVQTALGWRRARRGRTWCCRR